MKRTLVLVSLLILIASSVWALDVPALKGRVNDYGGMISPSAERMIEARLADFEQSESIQIVVLTIQSLKGDALEDFSIKVAESWKPGHKKIDSGALLLVSREDRKIRIEVGYGLEGKLTDLMAGRIIDDIITPEFRAGNFDSGIINGIDAMMSTVKGEFGPLDIPVGRRRPMGQRKGGSLFPFFFILIFIGFLGTIKPFLGGVAGAVTLPIIGAFMFGFSPLWLLLMLPLGFGLGFILPTLLALFFMGGGGYHRGGFGGGGFSGGGFSGGGGGFGGGGASGGW